MVLIVNMGVFSPVSARTQLTLAEIGDNAEDDGSQRSGNSAVYLRGSAAGIAKAEDEILFMYGTVEGNFDAGTYCSVISDSLNHSESGLSVRCGVNPDAGFLAVLIQNEHGIVVRYRTADGKSAKSVYASTTIFNYLRIKRVGNDFSIFAKTAAESDWQQVGSSYVLKWPVMLDVGVMHSSGDSGRATSAQFASIDGLPEETTGASCEPVLYDFDDAAPLDSLGFVAIQKWVLDSQEIRTDISTDSLETAQITTPSFVSPVEADTVNISWEYSFSGDTTPFLYDYGLYSVERLSLNDRAKISAPRIGCGSAVVSGTDDTLYTSLFAADSVYLFDRSKVFGDVVTSDACVYINGAAVYGTITQNAVFAQPVIPVYSVNPGSTTEKVYDSLVLTPGAYDTVLAYAYSKLIFNPGIYQFAKLICNPQVKIQFTMQQDDRVIIRVRDSLQIADRDSMFVNGPANAGKNVEIYTNQSQKMSIGTDTRLVGHFLVPNAEVGFVSRGIMIDGGIYARKISCEPDVAVTVSNSGVAHDRLTVKVIPENGADPVYSLAYTVHRGTMEDTLTDIKLLRDTTVVFAVGTGVETTLGTTMRMEMAFFPFGEEKRVRLLYNNGSGSVVLADTIPVDVDTLSALTFEFSRRGLFSAVRANVDNIAISCAADSCAPLIITEQPQNVAVYENSPVSFSCNASAGVNLPIYQWYRDTLSIPGASLRMYSIPSAVTGDDGAAFHCRITGECGEEATTNIATLTVSPCESPVILAQPDDDSVTIGQSAEFIVNASGYGLTYTWKENDETIEGADDSSLVVSAVTPRHNLNRYRVVITNECGKTVASREALLTVPDAQPCKITRQPRGDTLLEGDYYYASIEAECEEANYSWNKNGIPVSGADQKTMTYGPVVAADDGAQFYCVVDNMVTLDTSNIVTLIVLSPDAFGRGVAISGRLFNSDGSSPGNKTVEKFDFEVTLFSRKVGGTPLYKEVFRENHAVDVADGAFTVTLGRGKASADLQTIVLSHDELYAELHAGKYGGMELLGPRMRLTAAPYAFKIGVKVIYGDGNPDSLNVSAPQGALYVNTGDSNRTWKLTGSGWVRLD